MGHLLTYIIHSSVFLQSTKDDLPVGLEHRET